jgi:hypothetical protein
MTSMTGIGTTCEATICRIRLSSASDSAIPGALAARAWSSSSTPAIIGPPAVLASAATSVAASRLSRSEVPYISDLKSRSNASGTWLLTSVITAEYWT